ncbi:ATP phosphoribosyltransferase [Chloroflexota bacterium]
MVKIALPKGRLLNPTADLLERAGWGVEGYHEKINYYMPQTTFWPELEITVLQEKDIPIQISIGNYDLGICGLDWVAELLAKYPSSSLMKLHELHYGEGALYITSGNKSTPDSLDKLAILSLKKPVRIASEYPNIAESFALKNRFAHFSVFPVWGAAEVYPPESSELALIAAGSEGDLHRRNLKPVAKVLDFGACLVANSGSLKNPEIKKYVESILGVLTREQDGNTPLPPGDYAAPPRWPVSEYDDIIRLALPDGHQQKPTLSLLEKAGITLDDYPSRTGNRRPVPDMDGVAVKIIRPQDMPMQVANNNFDIALTGQDWVKNHLDQFPTSPVEILVDLGYGRVRIVAVVHKDVPVENLAELRHYVAKLKAPLRIASEYVNIADKVGRDNHLGTYRVVPTWGATEAFLPKDADMLIENTETGDTIARHGLKIIGTLFESTACLIGYKKLRPNSTKTQRIRELVSRFEAAAREM